MPTPTPPTPPPPPPLQLTRRRNLGLPEWYGIASVEGMPSIAAPVLDIPVLPVLRQRWGAPLHIDIALGLSGQRLCLLDYHSATHHAAVAFSPREFMALWIGEDEKCRAFAKTLRIGDQQTLKTITLWLENTTAIIDSLDGAGAPWRLRQRNGWLRAVPPEEAAPRYNDELKRTRESQPPT